MKSLQVIRPLFLIALGLHAGLLFIPLSGSSDEIIPAPDPEGDTISVTRVPPTANSQPTSLVANGAKPATLGERPVVATNLARTQSAAVSTPGKAQGTTTNPGQSSLRAPRRQPLSTPTNRPTRVGTNRTNAGASRTNTAPSAPATPPANTSNPTAGPRSNPNPAANSTEVPDLPSANQNSPSSTAVAANETSSPTPESSRLTALANSVSNKLPDSLVNLANWFRNVYVYRPENATPEAEIAAREQWLTELSASSGIETLQAETLQPAFQLAYPLEKSVLYERDFVSCLSEAPQPIAIGVFFDAAGALAAEPTLLRSSGYIFIDREALERIKQYPGFPAQRAQKAYTVTVEVAYDAETCFTVAGNR